jgi:hypothetical protein
MVDGKLRAYRASIQALVAFGKLDFLLTDNDDSETDWKEKDQVLGRPAPACYPFAIK